MDIQGLQTFLTIVKEGNISKTADVLCLAQSTITKRLQVLEDELGFNLFERGRGQKTMSLTSSGTSFLEIAEKWCDFFTEVADIKKHGPKISLSIGSLTTINFAVFPFLYQRLITHVPRIDLKIITSHSLDMFNLIEKRQIDVGVCFLAISSPNVQVYKLYCEPVIGICLPNSKIANRINISTDELDVENELYVRWDADFEEWHKHYFEGFHAPAIHLDNAQLVLDLFSNSDQWAIVPKSVAIYATKKLNFATFSLSDNDTYKRYAYLIMHKKPKQSARLGLNILLKLLHALPKVIKDEISDDITFYTEELPQKIL